MACSIIQVWNYLSFEAVEASYTDLEVNHSPKLRNKLRSNAQGRGQNLLNFCFSLANRRAIAP